MSRAHLTSATVRATTRSALTQYPRQTNWADQARPPEPALSYGTFSRTAADMVLRPGHRPGLRVTALLIECCRSVPLERCRNSAGAVFLGTPVSSSWPSRQGRLPGPSLARSVTPTLDPAPLVRILAPAGKNVSRIGLILRAGSLWGRAWVKPIAKGIHIHHPPGHSLSWSVSIRDVTREGNLLARKQLNVIIMLT